MWIDALFRYKINKPLAKLTYLLSSIYIQHLSQWGVGMYGDFLTCVKDIINRVDALLIFYFNHIAKEHRLVAYCQYETHHQPLKNENFSGLCTWSHANDPILLALLYDCSDNNKDTCKKYTFVSEIRVCFKECV